MANNPTFEQAQLHLQIFEMRRESKLREARDWYFKNYFPENLEDSMRIAAPGTQGGTFVMMVLGYWEQACAFLNYGLLHEDLFFETSAEFFPVWERMRPAIQEARKLWSNPNFLGHIEKAAERFEGWSEKRAPGGIATMRQFTKQMRAQAANATQALAEAAR